MTLRIRTTFVGDERAATMVEFSLLAPLLFILTIGVVDFAAVCYQFQALNAATAMAARVAATRGPVITGIPDCGVGTSGAAGTFCSQVSGSKTWASRTCTGGAMAPTPFLAGAACDNALMGRILTEMRKSYPPLVIDNVSVTYGPSGLGFSGLGKPVPTVTVRVTGVAASFIVISAFGLNTITMPPFTATVPAEDLSGT